MKNVNPIIGITLEGFQVFDKPTYIPLDRLTLMFGPNSAGKSAIEDAFDIHNTLIATDRDYSALGEFMVNREVRNLLMRHWRRSGVDHKLVEIMSIRIKYILDTNIQSDIAGFLGRKLINETQLKHQLELERRWYFVMDMDSDYDSDDERDIDLYFDIFIDSEIFIRRFNYVSFNLDHPVVQNIEKQIDFKQIANQYTDDVEFSEGIFTLKGFIFGLRPTGLDVAEKRDRWLSYSPVESTSTKTIQYYDLLHAAISELGLFIGFFLRESLLYFKPIKVSASRVVPTRQNMIFDRNRLDPPSHFWEICP